MMSCFFAMLFGIAIFCGGMLFERFEASSFEKEENETEYVQEDAGFLKQWENLLNYDGSQKEEEEYED